MVIEITNDNFEQEILQSDIPCLVEFTAGWCTFCDEMVPTLEALSDTFEGKVKFCIVNTDQEKALRIKFAVAAFPYIVWVADGMQAPLFDEIVTEERLEERIRFMLDGGAAPTARPL